MDMKRLKNVTPHIFGILIVLSILGGGLESLLYSFSNRGVTYGIYASDVVTDSTEVQNDDEYYHRGNINGNAQLNNDYGYDYSVKSVGPITLEKASYTEYIYFEENSDYIMIETFPSGLENYETRGVIESKTFVEGSEASSPTQSVETYETPISDYGLNIRIYDEENTLVKEFLGIKNIAAHKYVLDRPVKGKTYEVVASGPGFYGYYNIIWGNTD